jgi:hypothetical protein
MNPPCSTRRQLDTAVIEINRQHLPCFLRSQFARAEFADSSECRPLAIRSPGQSVGNPAVVSCRLLAMQCPLAVVYGRCWIHMGRPMLKMAERMIASPSAQLEHSAPSTVSCTVIDLLSQCGGACGIVRAQTVGFLVFQFPFGRPIIWYMSCALEIVMPYHFIRLVQLHLYSPQDSLTLICITVKALRLRCEG